MHALRGLLLAAFLQVHLLAVESFQLVDLLAPCKAYETNQTVLARALVCDEMHCRCFQNSYMSQRRHNNESLSSQSTDLEYYPLRKDVSNS